MQTETRRIAPDGLLWIHSSEYACSCEAPCDCDEPSTCTRCGAAIGAGIPYWAEIENYGVEVCENCPPVSGPEWDTIPR